MADKQSRFEAFLAEEINKYKGVAVPIKAGVLERMFVRQVNWNKLHPNPDDEFCDPKVGPHYGIISEYENAVRQLVMNAQKAQIEEPLTVEKMYPDGYLILNGHHRWAAAIRLDLKQIPIEIVNLTQEADIKKMLENAHHDKRVTLDLDEVVFLSDPDAPAEKGLSKLPAKRYKERLRLGIPALFHYLKTNGYDIWVYSSKYYSMEYIRQYFKWYHSQIDGIVTGTGRKSQNSGIRSEELEALIAAKYPTTIHIDDRSVLVVNSVSKQFEEHELSGNPETWSREIMDLLSTPSKS